MRKTILAAGLLIAIAAPASALADGTPPPPTTPVPAPTPATPTITLALANLVKAGGKQLALTGLPIAVHGTIAPYVAGEKVVVRAVRGGRKILVRSLTIQPTTGSTVGTFQFRVNSGKPGRLTIRASHLATAALGTAVALNRHVRVISPSASFGSRGPVVSLIQNGLARLHYAVSHSGVYDDSTGRAVLAYRKVNGMTRVETIDKHIILRLARGLGGFKAKYPSQGRHVEADLSRQVLVELNGATPFRIYHMSSGKPSTPTVLGTFHVYSKTPGVNAKLMFDANYFIRGYAIHGYPEVPAYAASHGCLRIPNADAPAVFGWVRVGTTVDVYR